MDQTFGRSRFMNSMAAVGNFCRGEGGFFVPSSFSLPIPGEPPGRQERPFPSRRPGRKIRRLSPKRGASQYPTLLFLLYRTIFVPSLGRTGGFQGLARGIHPALLGDSSLFVPCATAEGLHFLTHLSSDRCFSKICRLNIFLGASGNSMTSKAHRCPPW